jgi:hypothetical protein
MKRVISLVTVLAALIAATPARGVVETWIHPDADDFAVGSRARQIHNLTWFGSKLYAGYGDYGTNTGPTNVNPLTPSTDTFGPSVSQNTEEINVYRQLGDRKLYVPYVDPIGLAVGNPDYSVSTAFTGLNKFDGSHVFDMTSKPGQRRSMWAVGADVATNNGVIWRSLDSGATWSKVRSVTPPAGFFVRIYSAAWVDGKFYAQPVAHDIDSPAVAEMDMQAFTPGPGGGWSTQDSANLLFSHAQTYAGSLLYQSGLPGNSGIKPLCSYDVDSASSNGCVNAEDYNLDGLLLYRLDGANVYSSSDPTLGAWTTVLTSAPADAVSIEVVSGTVYVGTSDAEIVQLN